MIDLRTAHLPQETDALLVLNNAAVPAVNALDAEAFDALAAIGEVRVALSDGVIAGFVLTLGPGRDYASLNYRWFDGRYDAFWYVDRVIVGEVARGKGVGRALYDDVMTRAKLKGFPRVCAEVNVEPPNPVSIAFHKSAGFLVLEERYNGEDDKTVAMMTRPVEAA
ncbi:MAG: GNAT family N-acetyltransferase [Pseudomonadota bacterium]